MTHDLRPAAASDLTDAELAELVERDYVAYATGFAAVPGISILRSDRLVARRAELAHPYLNLVLGAWADEGNADALIDEARDALGGPGREFTWCVWPSNTPADLRRRLERAGFRHEGDGPLMTLDLDGADLRADVPADLAIELATNVEAVREGSALMLSSIGGDPEAQAAYTAAYEALAFGPDPALAYFLGRLDDRVVATSALYTGTGLAGVVGVGTLPEFRGRGFGRATTIAALEEGRRRGLRLGALMSSELGLPVYRRLGVREVGSVSFFASPTT